MARCPAQAVLPLVGLAAEKVIRDRYNCEKSGVLKEFVESGDFWTILSAR
ncbi:MAG: hypothetical protein ACQESR_26000 [Planctomycetota bacterium]